MPQLERIVAEKFDLFSHREDCVIDEQDPHAYRGIRRKAYLIDRTTGTRHVIQRQRDSHLVESTDAPGQINTPVADGVILQNDPQKLVVERGGGVLVVVRTGLVALNPEVLESTALSILRSEPHSDPVLKSPADETGSQLLKLLDNNHNASLQAKAQALLRSGMFSNKYCGIEYVGIGSVDSHARVAAQFYSTEQNVGGVISNVIDTDPVQLNPDSVEIDLGFDSTTDLGVFDGLAVGTNFEMTIEGSNAYLLTDSEAGFTPLDFDGCSVLSGILDTAQLVPRY